MIDETALMLKVKEGQLDYLSVLFENNRVGLFNFFLRMGINRALSEDLIQESFIRILASRATYRAKSSFKAWLYQIARNAVVDHFRKMANQNVHESYEEENMRDQETLVESLEQEAQLTLFDRALAKLPVEQREIIILSRFQQLNYSEISELLNCNINTLKTRMRVAIIALRKHYQILNGEVTS